MIEVRKSSLFGWLWTCDVCHFGMNMPWEEEETWADAIAATESHIDLHRAAGLRYEWKPVL